MFYKFLKSKHAIQKFKTYRKRKDLTWYTHRKSYFTRTYYHRRCKLVNGIHTIGNLEKKLRYKCDTNMHMSIQTWLEYFVDQIPITLWNDQVIMRIMVNTLEDDNDLKDYLDHDIHDNYDQFENILHLKMVIENIYDYYQFQQYWFRQGKLAKEMWDSKKKKKKHFYYLFFLKRFILVEVTLNRRDVDFFGRICDSVHAEKNRVQSKKKKHFFKELIGNRIKNTQFPSIYRSDRLITLSDSRSFTGYQTSEVSGSRQSANLEIKSSAYQYGYILIQREMKKKIRKYQKE